MGCVVHENTVMQPVNGHRRFIITAHQTKARPKETGDGLYEIAQCELVSCTRANFFTVEPHPRCFARPHRAAELVETAGQPSTSLVARTKIRATETT
jgi:hypothetical protein